MERTIVGEAVDPGRCSRRLADGSGATVYGDPANKKVSIIERHHRGVITNGTLDSAQATRIPVCSLHLCVRLARLR